MRTIGIVGGKGEMSGICPADIPTWFAITFSGVVRLKPEFSSKDSDKVCEYRLHCEGR